MVETSSHSTLLMANKKSDYSGKKIQKIPCKNPEKTS